jgi:hypothetical protein
MNRTRLCRARSMPCVRAATSNAADCCRQPSTVSESPPIASPATGFTGYVRPVGTYPQRAVAVPGLGWNDNRGHIHAATAMPAWGPSGSPRFQGRSLDSLPA